MLIVGTLSHCTPELVQDTPVDAFSLDVDASGVTEKDFHLSEIVSIEAIKNEDANFELETKPMRY